jgi:Amt family ammonium transporter
MLTASALVLLMIPGLAFFYGGMVRSKSVLNMLMMLMSALFIVGILWVLYGYSMAFGDSYGQAGLLGNVTQYLGLEGLMVDDPEAGVPAMAFVAFQAMFACITVGLIAGAIAASRFNFTWTVRRSTSTSRSWMCRRSSRRCTVIASAPPSSASAAAQTGSGSTVRRAWRIVAT